MAPRFVARQLAHPTGLYGRVIGHLMNLHNARMNAFAVEQLALDPADRVLEVGFGGGVALKRLVQSGAFVAGVDRSGAMVDRARSIYAEAVAAGRVDFREGTVETLPFETASFGKALTVNTVYFWTSLDAGFAEIHRVVSPGGRLAVGFLPKEHMDRMQMPTDIFTTRSPDDVMTALANAGFTDACVERPTPKTPWNVIIADRP